ncbi:hypothetical protein M427DRAFT_446879 [Gonapodya prolifera JEL478]|uniref:Uncharacterized protein n=1 Tax=Gonapodya prolifera (strain JEL478) TaxID=1344416 RepID=A0A139A369_GONPJ|nr:hypothetical protein M427DRAFT_446879 [Gonapodya prolifera JEL478]|eukprot:KXS11078.1 hypothetical protein M427DRAFT_446879 [Gonapodya prolifera JEL478]
MTRTQNVSHLSLSTTKATFSSPPASLVTQLALLSTFSESSMAWAGAVILIELTSSILQHQSQSKHSLFPLARVTLTMILPLLLSIQILLPRFFGITPGQTNDATEQPIQRATLALSTLGGEVGVVLAVVCALIVSCTCGQSSSDGDGTEGEQLTYQEDDQSWERGALSLLSSIT